MKKDGEFCCSKDEEKWVEWGIEICTCLVLKDLMIAESKFDIISGNKWENKKDEVVKAKVIFLIFFVYLSILCFSRCLFLVSLSYILSNIFDADVSITFIIAEK